MKKLIVVVLLCFFVFVLSADVFAKSDDDVIEMVLENSYRIDELEGKLSVLGGKISLNKMEGILNTAKAKRTKEDIRAEVVARMILIGWGLWGLSEKSLFGLGTGCICIYSALTIKFGK